MRFPGHFETHLTISQSTPAAIASLQSFARQHHLKCTHILLSRGHHISQPMITRHSTGTLDAELAAAQSLRTQLSQAGFHVSRIKIEVDPANPDVPQAQTDIPLHLADRYFEHHIKLLLPANADLAPLAAIAQRHNAHLSRNALRTRPDNYEERFVTRRCYRATRAAAHAQLHSLLAALAGYNTLDVEEEFVIHDSQLSLDAGWLTPEDPA